MEKEYSISQYCVIPCENKIKVTYLNLLNCGNFFHCRKYGNIAAGFQEVRNALATKTVVQSLHLERQLKFRHNQNIMPNIIPNIQKNKILVLTLQVLLLLVLIILQIITNSNVLKPVLLQQKTKLRPCRHESSTLARQ